MPYFGSHSTRLHALLLVAAHLKTSQESWTAVLMEIQVFASIKTPANPDMERSSSTASLSPLSRHSQTPSSHLDLSLSDTSAPTQVTHSANQNPPLQLPHDVILAILEHVAPTTIPQCALVSRAWNQATSLILYSRPYLPSLVSISLYLSVVELSKAEAELPDTPPNHQPFHRMARSITFSRQQLHNASQDPKQKHSDNIVKSQSSLFRLLVIDRMNDEWMFVHPLVMRLLEACERVDNLSEVLGEENSASRPASRRRTNRPSTGVWHSAGDHAVDENNTQDGPSVELLASALQTPPTPPTTPPINPSSNTQARPRIPTDSLMDPARLLTNLLHLYRRLLSIFSDFGISPPKAYDSLIVLLSLFQSRELSFWAGTSEASFESVKSLVFAQLRPILNAMSTAILIEVQYITLSSQRLLDTYCMMYYRALAYANSLNLSLVLDILQEAARAKHLFESCTTSSAAGHSDSQPTCASSAERILQAMQLMFHRNPFNLPRAQQPYSTPEPLESDNQVHVHLSNNHDLDSTEEEPKDFDSIGGLLSSRSALREGILSFAPGSMNSETAEFIEELLDPMGDLEVMLKNEDASGSLDEYERAMEMAKCIRWMKEVVRWQKAGKQMEPVKDLLRRSMARIDRLRMVQRRYGISFMD
ncbi:hypothetical protein BJ741DRAFT_610911 [Chytriomyces cf. hyalinus JEL632]|nr:hypothetical protein BJ741DRAFT_610911 [Chytriomyces cf. hyalinus JEL632]